MLKSFEVDIHEAGRAMKLLRQQHDWSQGYLAGRIGASSSATISQYENDNRANTALEMLDKVAAACGYRVTLKFERK